LPLNTFNNGTILLEAKIAKMARASVSFSKTIDDPDIHHHTITFFAANSEASPSSSTCQACSRVATSGGYRCAVDGFVMCTACVNTLRAAFTPSLPKRYSPMFGVADNGLQVTIHFAHLLGSYNNVSMAVVIGIRYGGSILASSSIRIGLSQSFLHHNNRCKS
jgi:hypothetical protein